MPAMGQKRTCAVQKQMYAKGPKRSFNIFPPIDPYQCGKFRHITLDIISSKEAQMKPRRSGLLSLVILAGIVVLAGPAQAQSFSAQSISGTVAAPKQVNLGALPQITAAELAAMPKVIKPFYSGTDPATFAAKKAQAAGRHIRAPQGAVTSDPRILQSNGALETPSGIGWKSTNLAGCGGVPADQALAVGAGAGAGDWSVIQLMNLCVDVYDKLGGLAPGYPKSLQTFFGYPGSLLFDPRAMYDWINHRYIVMAIVCPGATSGSQCFTLAAPNYVVAVSEADDPNGTWYIYSHAVYSVAPSGGVYPFPDFPRLGQDRQNIYIGSNIFTDSFTFKWEEIIAWPKAQLYTGAGFSFSGQYGFAYGGVYTDSTQPADVYSAGDQPRTEYLVTSRNMNFGNGSCFSNCNGLFIWAWYDPFNTTGSGNTLTGVNVATANNYSVPPDASQYGTTAKIGTDDTRISGSVQYSAGQLYASLNTNGGGGAPGCVLYSIEPFVSSDTGAISSATIRNEILIHDPGAGFKGWYYCTQQPDPEGNVTTVFNYSSASAYAGLAYVTRRSTQPPGTLTGLGIYLQVGLGTYSYGRWGDYTATSVAGLVSGGGTGGFPTFWYSGMYAETGGLWGSAIGKNGYTNLSQP
jgi:hypothetical protein